MLYTQGMKDQKRYPFRFTPLMLALFWAGLMLSLAGLALTVWRFSAFLMDGAFSALGWVQHIILFLVAIVLTVLLASFLVRSEYVIDDKNVTLKLGLIPVKYPLKALRHIHLFRGSQKLALYFEGEKPTYTAVVIAPSQFENFTQELLTRCPQADFSFSSPEEEEEYKRKK